MIIDEVQNVIESCVVEDSDAETLASQISEQFEQAYRKEFKVSQATCAELRFNLHKLLAKYQIQDLHDVLERLMSLI